MSIQYKHTALMNRLKQGYDRLRGKNAGLPFTGYGLQAATGCDEARGGDERRKAMIMSSLCFTSEFMPDGSPTFKTKRILKDCTGFRGAV